MIREFQHQEEGGPDTWARLGQAGGVVLTRLRRERGSGEPPSTEPG